MMSAGGNEPPICPVVYIEVEDATTYAKTHAIDVWAAGYPNLEIWMQKQRTHPEIIHVICAKLLAWQSGSREEIPAGTFHEPQLRF
jgi:hypothetical protein